MSTETVVLRALYRLARRRRPATMADLLARVGPHEPGRVVRALASLVRDGLAEVTAQGAPRLSLAGLAVAVAVASAPSASRSRARPNVARVLPLVRRQSAA